MEPTTYLFLDIDGVLQTPALGDFIEMEHLPTLEDWLRTHPRVKVVLCSSHREGTELATIRSWFSQDLASRVVGATPMTALTRSRGGRKAEIEAWLRDNAMPGSAWVALDDEPLLYGERCPRLVCVHPWTGVMESHLQEAEDKLDRQLKGLPLVDPEQSPQLFMGKAAPRPAEASTKAVKPAPAGSPLKPGLWSRLRSLLG